MSNYLEKLSLKIPLHVSGIWYPVIEHEPLKSGSIGAGINLSLYLRVKQATKSDCSIILNGVSILREHAETICSFNKLRSSVILESPIPLGYGYGVSAASLLAHSLSQLSLGLKKTLEKAAWASHVAEVKYMTGLGDVIAEFYGGAEIRVKPGPPGIGIVEHIFVTGRENILATIIPEQTYDTPTMLSNIKSNTYSYGYRLLQKLFEEPTLKNFFDLSRDFTSKLFDYKIVDEILRPYRDKIIGYYRKKGALIIWVEDEWKDDLYDHLARKYSIVTFKTRIDSRGVIIDYTSESS